MFEHLAVWARMSNTEYAPIMAGAWHEHQTDPKLTFPAVGHVHGILDTFGWQWPARFTWVTHRNEVLELVCAPTPEHVLTECRALTHVSKMVHEAKAAWRIVALGRAAARRRDCRDLQVFDFEAHRSFIAQQQGVYRKVARQMLCGGVNTAARLANQDIDATCLWCGNGIEDEVHRCWDCPAHNDLRANRMPPAHVIQSLPCTTKCLGVWVSGTNTRYQEAVQSMMLDIAVRSAVSAQEAQYCPQSHNSAPEDDDETLLSAFRRKRSAEWMNMVKNQMRRPRLPINVRAGSADPGPRCTEACAASPNDTPLELPSRDVRLGIPSLAHHCRKASSPSYGWTHRGPADIRGRLRFAAPFVNRTEGRFEDMGLGPSAHSLGCWHGRHDQYAAAVGPRQMGETPALQNDTASSAGRASTDQGDQGQDHHSAHCSRWLARQQVGHRQLCGMLDLQNDASFSAGLVSSAQGDQGQEHHSIRCSCWLARRQVGPWQMCGTPALQNDTVSSAGRASTDLNDRRQEHHSAHCSRWLAPQQGLSTMEVSSSVQSKSHKHVVKKHNLIRPHTYTCNVQISICKIIYLNTRCQ